ncbi:MULTISPECIES: DUF4148 domain-containing protein [Thauera]|jgi:hypothetical protein|uniref:DUF4148 domain-containing protein n=3 Tax=Thauera TaxID=33057 RepID=N6ZX05_9RHOO|nr:MULTISPECIES: DUF4148 domain-containing protein [Thauera]HNS93383.1 DUF4148 domain-containing protein [Thauera sp.]APR05284.1 hypothetical protein Tchl_2452 [Thauera chlorobenzoica]APR05700.1 hypothetical protein Tchl_2877 [Thauera chlorobenzoica]AVR88761.1 hypothetical protein Tharo_1854 [Thauera aromatica K172]ENO98853.1 hypothetical protein C667_01853 [Thauera phenylacetica B4P]
MSKIRTATVLPILAVVLVVPSVAQANSEWHFTGGEVGYTSFPDHVTSTKTRAEVLRELEQAKADGSYFYLQRGVPVPSRDTGPGKTREQVLKELVNISPEERARMDELYVGQ